ncbi:hypothetical protein [Myroides indicus]|uniref:Uncharacterized protein n=1 Tax=Myroides indicus TaxID=1323422 RepID=A0A4R7F5P1_9FLAO|nr:hypothetical protein [Myroides indicus]TDS65002.1 hypothetical protein C8P70_10322 [Myroides indicus]
MKTVFPKQLKIIDLETEYNNFLKKLEKAQLNNQKTIYLDELSYDLHLKLISENYRIKKIIKNSLALGFIRKRTKQYCILLS